MGARNWRRAVIVVIGGQLKSRSQEAIFGNARARRHQRLDIRHPRLQTLCLQRGTCALGVASLVRLSCGRLLWRGTVNDWHGWKRALELRGGELDLRR